MNHLSRYPFVLAIALSSKGFGFVLFEGSESPFTWRASEILGRDKNAKILERVTALIKLYGPEALVLEDIDDRGCRRGTRNRNLSRALARLAERECVKVVRYSRSQVMQSFSPTGIATKYEIAMLIAKHIPALAPRMPKVRKPWMSEELRQGVFDAAALGITFYGRSGTQGR
jgi:hypothetical protein